MSGADAALRQHARRAGLHPRWTDVAGIEREVPPAVLEAVLEALGRPLDATAAPLLTCIAGQSLAIAGGTSAAAAWQAEDGRVQPARCNADGRWTAPSEPGYWHWCQDDRAQAVAVAPAQAWFPAAHGGVRHWGLAAQVYSLRGEGDGGIGDDGGCRPWIEALAREGGAALALSPMHAAMPVPTRYSPYSPSDRRWLEPLHASPRQVLGEAADAVRRADPRLDARLREAEAAALIDWPAAAAAKWHWIECLPGWLQTHQPQRWEQIQADMQALGDGLPAWSAQSAALAHGSAATFAFGQWLAQAAWRQRQQQARAAGLAIGLVADLAIGFDPAGVEAQDNAASILQGLELGAPPDAFNPHGQAWGITGYSPLALRAGGYAPYIALLRAVMAHRGGVRIDHVLGLQRLWVLPRGAGAGQGVYLDYPFEDLLNLLVLESWRHRCLVIGEDLGVVPPGIRATLAARGVLGMDVLAFSRDEDGFWPPHRWRGTAVAMTSTHDLPPLAGWLQGSDLDWRRTLGWSTAAADAQARLERRAAVDALARRAASEGLHSGDPQRDAIALTARSPARLALLPLEDALGLGGQPNLPGTVDEHPNWRQRLPAQPGDGTPARLRAFAAGRATRSPT